MIRRFLKWGDQLLLSIDQMALLLIQFVTYVIFSSGHPNADETISSHIGRSAMAGKRWALLLEPVVNRIFFWQRDGAGRLNHCRHAIEWDEIPHRETSLLKGKQNGQYDSQ